MPINKKQNADVSEIQTVRQKILTVPTTDIYPVLDEGSLTCSVTHGSAERIPTTFTVADLILRVQSDDPLPHLVRVTPGQLKILVYFGLAGRHLTTREIEDRLSFLVVKKQISPEPLS